MTVFNLDALQPATWGCSHGSGFLGTTIRQAQVQMSRSARFPAGDVQASWAGHCFFYVGKRDFAKPGHPPDIDHAIIEAEWPTVVLSRASRHADAIWAVGQPLTPQQRQEGTLAALTLLGHRYDAFAYLYFLAKVAQVRTTGDLAPLFTATAKTGPICSGVVVRCEQKMNVDLGPLAVASIADPDFISPADCLRWGLDNGWMNTRPPPWQ